jgi:hypothetical protein
LQGCCYLINDDGEVVCYRIDTSRSLFDFMTPANILDVFDEINSFVFPTPIVKVPENGVGYEDVRIFFNNGYFSTMFKPLSQGFGHGSN